MKHVGKGVEVNKLFVQNNILFAEAEIKPHLEYLIKMGRFKKISSAFFLPNASPIRNYHYLNHVGFLGALPPAVKGLPSPTDAIATASFNEYKEINEAPEILFFNEANYANGTNNEALHQKALYIQKITGMSYRDAIDTIVYN